MDARLALEVIGILMHVHTEEVVVPMYFLPAHLGWPRPAALDGIFHTSWQVPRRDSTMIYVIHIRTRSRALR